MYLLFIYNPKFTLFIGLRAYTIKQIHNHIKHSNCQRRRKSCSEFNLIRYRFERLPLQVHFNFWTFIHCMIACVTCFWLAPIKYPIYADYSININIGFISLTNPNGCDSDIQIYVCTFKHFRVRYQSATRPNFLDLSMGNAFTHMNSWRITKVNWTLNESVNYNAIFLFMY